MNKRKILSWVLFLGWLLMIFFFSSQNGEESGNLSNGILLFIEKVTHVPLTNEIASFIIRKCAHFTEYMVLGILTIQLYSEYYPVNKKYFFLALLFCTVYAISDEIHQLFIENRAGNIYDVTIDSLGSMFGMVLFCLRRNLKKKVSR